MISCINGVLHKYGVEAHELATTHAALHKRGTLMDQWLETTEEHKISVQHYAPREKAYPNALN